MEKKKGAARSGPKGEEEENCENYTMALPSLDNSTLISASGNIMSLCAFPDMIIGRQISLWSTTQSTTVKSGATHAYLDNNVFPKLRNTLVAKYETMFNNFVLGMPDF